LPLQNISPDPKDEYFADGMTEELISTVSKIRGLRVIARTSVMGYKGGEKKIGEIARELTVGTILEGSVRKAGDKLRITVQLIDSSNEEHLWVQNYDRQLEDVFAIQTEVARNVADALKTQLLDEERQQIEKKPTGNIGGYTLYLKGKHYWSERNKESLERAIEYFEEAIKRDPKFALAYSGLADCYLVLVDHGYLAPREGYAKAREAATKALQLDDTLAEAHTSLALLLSNHWDWTQAEEEFAKALRANPNYATAHHWYSIHLLSLGRLDEAFRESRIAEELDPLSPIIHASAGMNYFFARQYDSAMKELDKALELDPNFAPAHGNRCDVYLAKSMFEKARTELEWLSLHSPPADVGLLEAQFRSYVHAMSGRTDEAKRILQQCEESFAHAREEDMSIDTMANFASIHGKLGSKDRALEWLEKAFEARTITPFLAKLSPYFDEITSDPRFEELTKKTLRSLDTT
jgi:adenylate cyclase